MARRTYPLDLKASASELVTEQGRGPKDAAAGLGVAPSAMRYRVRRAGSRRSKITDPRSIRDLP